MGLRRHSLLRLVICAALLWWAPRPVMGEIAGAGATVPRPRGGTVEVERGGEVRIPLGIYGLTPGQVTFVIRQGPSRGTLSEIEIHDRTTSVVTYSHAGTPGETADSFTFAAKNDAGVSAPATIRVRITDRPALLMVPSRLIHEATTVGASHTQSLSIENRGGGLVRGVVAVDAPWRIEGDPRYEVGPGDSTSVVVVFEPDRTGEQRAYLRYSSHPTHQTELRGRGLPPFSVSSAEVALDEATREGEFQVQNHTDQSLSLTVSEDRRLILAREIALESGAQVAVKVAVADDAREAFQAKLAVESSSHRETVLVQAPAAPPALRVEPSRLENLDPEVAHRVTVTNAGGLPAKVSVKAPPGMTVQPKEFGLAPRRQETLTLHPGDSAVTQGEIVLSYNGQILALPFEFHAPAAHQLPSLAPALSAPTPRTLTLTPPEAEPAVKEGIEPIDPAENRVATLPPIGRVRLSEIGRRKAALTWEAVPGLKYHVEQRHLELRDGKLFMHWMASPEDRPASKTREGSVVFKGLEAGRSYTVRLYGEDAAGAFTPPSAPLSFHTLPRARLLPLARTTLLLGLAGMVGLLAYRRWRARAGKS